MLDAIVVILTRNASYDVMRVSKNVSDSHDALRINMTMASDSVLTSRYFYVKSVSWTCRKGISSEVKNTRVQSYPEMMGTLLICISKVATPGRLQFSYDLYRRYFITAWMLIAGIENGTLN